MRPFEKILVPTDFSAHSIEAIRTAADIAARYDATITLVHAFTPVAYPLPEGFVLLTAAQMAELQTDFDRLLACAKREAEAAGARRVSTVQLMGSPEVEIAQYARDHAVDLIVMGTHGRTGIPHALLGSVAERVLRRASCPVLCVRAPADRSDASLPVHDPALQA